MFNRRKLRQQINLYEPRPNIGYKIRREKLKRKGINLLDTVLGGVMIAVMIVTYLSCEVKKDLMATQRLPEAQEGVVIQSEGSEAIDNLWRTIPTLENGSAEQNEKIAYAYMISGNNIDFIYTINGENGLWTHDRVHNPGANTVGVDMGFGINSYFHPEIVNDDKFWNDWKWNIDRTFQLWDSGVTFYGYSKKGIIF